MKRILISTGFIVFVFITAIFAQDIQNHFVLADYPGATPDYFKYPKGIATDGKGMVFVIDKEARVIKLYDHGSPPVVFAGSGKEGFADGTGEKASFYRPYGLAMDAASNLYTGDIGCIRKITPKGAVTTLAGTGNVEGKSNGKGKKASFGRENGALCADATGNVYFLDAGNELIRKIAPDGTVSTYLSNEQFPESASESHFLDHYCTDIAIDEAGNLYLCSFGKSRAWKVTPKREVSVIAVIPGNDSGKNWPSSVIRVPADSGEKFWHLAVNSNQQLHLSTYNDYQKTYSIWKLPAPASDRIFSNTNGLTAALPSVTEAKLTARISVPRLEASDGLWITFDDLNGILGLDPANKLVYGFPPQNEPEPAVDSATNSTASIDTVGISGIWSLADPAWPLFEFAADGSWRTWVKRDGLWLKGAGGNGATGQGRYRVVTNTLVMGMNQEEPRYAAPFTLDGDQLTVPMLNALPYTRMTPAFALPATNLK